MQWEVMLAGHQRSGSFFVFIICLSYYTKLTPVLFERGHETVLIVVEVIILESQLHLLIVNLIYLMFILFN